MTFLDKEINTPAFDTFEKMIMGIEGPALEGPVGQLPAGQTPARSKRSSIGYVSSQIDQYIASSSNLMNEILSSNLDLTAASPNEAMISHDYARTEPGDMSQKKTDNPFPEHLPEEDFKKIMEKFKAMTTKADEFEASDEIKNLEGVDPSTFKNTVFFGTLYKYEKELVGSTAAKNYLESIFELMYTIFETKEQKFYEEQLAEVWKKFPIIAESLQTAVTEYNKIHTPSAARKRRSSLILRSRRDTEQCECNYMDPEIPAFTYVPTTTINPNEEAVKDIIIYAITGMVLSAIGFAILKFFF